MRKRHVARPTLEPVEGRLAPTSLASFFNPITQVSSVIAAITGHDSSTTTKKDADTAAKKDAHPAAKKDAHPAAKKDAHPATAHAARAKPAKAHPKVATTAKAHAHKAASSSSSSTFDQILKSAFPPF